jgi:putative Mg2+ transporter-C (MgtC) family protein
MPGLEAHVLTAQPMLLILASGMSEYLGDLHKVLSQPFCSIALVFVSVICGTLIGLEREAREKPAGVKTVSLICMGSTIFTIVSILVAGDSGADRGRVAAQVVTGIGFLGAGAIIRDGGTVIGLTTAATIWVVSAIGLLIGAGYAAGGLALSILVLSLLTVFRHIEHHRRPAGRREENENTGHS